MQRAVQRQWTPDSHWHIGDLAWQSPSLSGRTVELWFGPDGEIDAWAVVSPPGRLELLATPNRVDDVLSWFAEIEGERTVTVMDSDKALVAALIGDGYREVDEPYFRHCLRQLDGSLAASALGWYDEVNRVGLLEPVGTDPRHARKGLGAAVSLACLGAMRDAGANLAVVCPRGDDAYPVPRALYHHIGFRDGGRTVTYRR